MGCCFVPCRVCATLAAIQQIRGCLRRFSKVGRGGSSPAYPFQKGDGADGCLSSSKNARPVQSQQLTEENLLVAHIKNHFQHATVQSTTDCLRGLRGHFSPEVIPILPFLWLLLSSQVQAKISQEGTVGALPEPGEGASQPSGISTQPLFRVELAHVAKQLGLVPASHSPSCLLSLRAANSRTRHTVSCLFPFLQSTWI